MRFCIHRAAAQVGGNCIEVKSGGQSILLDLGLPLGAEKAVPALLPPVPGIDGNAGTVLAVVLSHPHQDHYGLLVCSNPDWPVYIGEGAEKLLRAAAFFTSGAEIHQPITTYRSGEAFEVGPFRITPIPVDHSAYDAHALLVEADERRLLYSGDFRAHGRKSEMMERLFAAPPCPVDILLMEGTTLGRTEETEPLTEDELESEIASALSRCEGLALAYFSAQNVDRLVTFYRAAEEAERILVVDAYTACIIKSVKPDGIPVPAPGGVRVYLPKRQKLQIVRAKRFDLVEPFRRERIYSAEIASNPHRWVMLFRESMVSDVEDLGCLDRGTLMYSLWPGYLDRDPFDLRAWASKHGMSFEVWHTSGHAYLKDLKRFVEHFAPKCLVPIHTVRPKRYPGLFPNVRIVPEGEWCEV